MLAHNAPAIGERLAALARYLDLPGHDAGAVVQWTLKLRQEIGIPHTLKEIGVGEDMIEAAAPMAEIDPSTGGNPVAVTAKDYELLYRKAILGEI